MARKGFSKKKVKGGSNEVSSSSSSSSKKFCPSTTRKVPHILRPLDSNTNFLFNTICKACERYSTAREDIMIGFYKEKKYGAFVKFFNIEKTAVYHLNDICIAENEQLYMPVQDTPILWRWGLRNARESFDNNKIEANEVVNYLILTALKSTDIYIEINKNNEDDENEVAVNGILYLDDKLVRIMLDTLKEYTCKIEEDELFVFYRIQEKDS